MHYYTLFALTVHVSFLLFSPDISIIPNDKGFNISNAEATVKCLIATVPMNIQKLEPQLHSKYGLQSYIVIYLNCSVMR